jgi:hypothetical protein
VSWSPSKTTAAVVKTLSVSVPSNQLAGEEESTVKKNTSSLQSFTSLMDRISPDKMMGDTYQQGVSKVKLPSLPSSSA